MRSWRVRRRRWGDGFGRVVEVKGLLGRLDIVVVLGGVVVADGVVIRFSYLPISSVVDRFGDC